MTYSFHATAWIIDVIQTTRNTRGNINDSEYKREYNDVKYFDGPSRMRSRAENLG